jgi:hypothetical protein
MHGHAEQLAQRAWQLVSTKRLPASCDVGASVPSESTASTHTNAPAPSYTLRSVCPQLGSDAASTHDRMDEAWSASSALSSSR